MASMEGTRFEVRGEVQGVGYRYFVLGHAQRLQLRGWVRNRPDASVEVAAYGAPGRLRELEAQLWAGPPAARVAEVRRSAWRVAEEGEAPAGFAIVRG
ncbi:MAG TPA: acylphosphatase [Terriglobales bacterium]|nr:acylphosphatase [Terriglobales bacterium]